MTQREEDLSWINKEIKTAELKRFYYLSTGCEYSAKLEQEHINRWKRMKRYVLQKGEQNEKTDGKRHKLAETSDRVSRETQGC